MRHIAKIRNLLFVLAVTINFSCVDWNQIGDDIVGSHANHKTGHSVSLSDNGITMAVGTPFGSTFPYSENGIVRVYNYDGSDWIQIGGDITGIGERNNFGISANLSGNGLAVAAGANGQVGSGSVRVYSFDGTSWNPKGSLIRCDAIFDGTGRNVSINVDGSVVVFGVPNSNSGLGVYNHASVYTYDESTLDWVKMGDDILGDAPDDYMGWSVSINDAGTRVAIGAQDYSRVYEFISGAWTQIGADLAGVTAWVSSYNSISLDADGTTVALGTISEFMVYEYVGSTWSQKGSSISSADEDKAVSISADGNTVALGASNQVKVYRFKGAEWRLKGKSILGEAVGDKFGFCISLSADGSTVSIGAPLNDAGGITDAGCAQAYKYKWTWIL